MRRWNIYGKISKTVAPAWDARTIPVDPGVEGMNHAKIRIKRGIFSPGKRFPEIKTLGMDDITTAGMIYGAERNSKPSKIPNELIVIENVRPIRIVENTF